MELNPLDQLIASIPLWLRLIPALVAATGLAWGVWTTRDKPTRTE